MYTGQNHRILGSSSVVELKLSEYSVASLQALLSLPSSFNSSGTLPIEAFPL